MKLPFVWPEWRNFDPFFASLVLILSVLGIFFISSATAEAGELVSGRTLKQTLFLGVSLVALLAILHFDYEWLRHHAYVIYLGGFALLVLVLFLGTSSGGGMRWFRFGPLRLQPSEFMKVALILSLAKLLHYYDGFKNIHGLLRPFLITVGPMGLILLQPDLGTALCFLPVLFVMLIVAGARWKHLILVICLGILATPFIFSYGLKDYQKTRITAFITALIDGANTDELREALFQLERGKLAIGSGQAFGKGYRQGTVPVPEQSTDFIFTVAGEEGGFFGGFAVIGLYLLLTLYMLGIASHTRERFGLLVVSGAAALLAFQSLVNIAMTMGFAPITGLTLPFLSYGGSSLLSTYVLVALVMNIQMRRLRPMADDNPMDDHEDEEPRERTGLPLTLAAR